MTSSSIPAVPVSGRRAFVTVDGWALKSNWRHLANLAPSARTGAAVKANGYGLGLVPVAKSLFAAGCREFFVAWAEEGAELRRAMPRLNYRVFVLQGLDAQAAALCREHKLIPVLSTPGDVETWVAAGVGRLPGAAALQFETGMNRLGLDEADARKAQAVARAGGFDVTLVLSHLASADEPASDQSERQRGSFERIAAHFPHVARSLANSAGVFLGRPYHFDLTRPGIALFGGGAALDPSQAIRAVATLHAHVLQVRTVARGETAGYGAAARLDRATRIATIGLGYADGFPRAGSGTADRASGEPAPEMFAGGRRVPVLGRVSMDLTLLDVTDLPEDALSPGDTVEVFGANVPVDETARRCGTIAYELLTSLGPRVARLLV